MALIAPEQTERGIRFEAITIDDGLSQGLVRSIIQDKKGLMWFTTSDGLNKYDGNKITVFSHNPDDSTTIASDDLAFVFEDSKERLWIGTRKNGLDYFDRKNNIFYHFTYKNASSIRSDNLLNISEDKAGNLWIRTHKGIDRLKVSDAKASSVRPANKNFFTNHSFEFIHIRLDSLFETERERVGAEKVFIDSYNQILITSNRNLFELKYNYRSKAYHAIKRYSFQRSDTVTIPELLEDTVQNNLLINTGAIILFPGYDFSAARQIYSSASLPWIIDKHNQLWFRDQKKTVQLNLLSAEANTLIPADPLHVKAFQLPSIYYIDHTGILWIGSNGYGILKYDFQKENFHHILPQLYPYQLVELDSGEIITNRLDRITVKKNNPVTLSGLIDSANFKTAASDILSNSIAKDKAGNVWSCNNTAIIKYNNKAKTLTKYKIPFALFSVMPYPIYADSKNNIWMGYNQFLVKYNPQSGYFTRFNIPGYTSSYENTFLQCIYEDQGQLWLGLTEGILTFDLYQMQFKRYYINKERDTTSLSNNFVYTFARDERQPERYLWVGTKGGGLNRLDKRTGLFTRYTTRKGLANNVVYGILTDNNGDLWISTNRGISAFTPTTEQFRNYTIHDGLQSNEFNRFSFCKTHEGLLVFGGVNGLNYFDPDDIKILQSPQVIFTGFRLNNKSANFKEPNSPLTEAIEFSDQIRLSYQQNVLTFEFAATDYRKKGSMKFRYRMEGFDEDWIYAGNISEATYTNLDPGVYQFKVQASFENGIWGNRSSSIGLRVDPPWWRTGWFYLLTTSSLLSGTYLLYRFRLRQSRRLEILRNRIARDLHDEIGSSISTISIYSKIILERVGSSTFNNEPLLQKITEHATEIMEAMNDIVWNINTKNDTFESIISRMREHAYQLFEAKGYTLHFEFDENLPRTKLDMEKRRNFYLIYKEALNNIAKYANGKNIWISVNIKNSAIHLIIKDDGQGFDLNTVKTKSNGLTNMDHRAQAMNGNLKITSALGKGTTLELNF